MPLDNSITLQRTNSSNPDFRLLIPQLDKELADRYGELQTIYDRYNQIIDINTVIIACRDNEPIGCGCFKQIDEHSVEIKRMFVKAEARGLGIATAILSQLELWAWENGFSYTVLETGDKQHEAIALYQKLGYTIIPNYGQYSGMESSICMQKEL
jgi:GNAT superfamily N-acetyltransferase